jgi:hypothetical protein
MPYRYDPNQPRVPAGHSDGGQWTDGNSGGERHLRTERPTSPLFELSLQEFQRHGAQSVTDVSARARRLSPWRAFPLPTKPSPLFELGARAPMPPETHPAAKDMESALGLYDALSLHNSPEQRAVIAFKARDYRRGEAPVLELLRVGILTRSEVGLICKQFGTVQDLTDKAAAAVQAEKLPLDPGQYGTAVHTLVKEAVNGPKKPKSSGDVRAYPKLWAEESFAKNYEESREHKSREAATIGNPSPQGPGDTYYGAPGSIRVDVYEEVNPKTVCVYDIKTGRSGLSGPHMLEIAIRVARRLPGARIVVMEMRPTLPRVLTPRP